MFHANIYGLLDGGMVIIQLHRWKFSHKGTLQQTLFDWNWILYKKKQKSRFLSHPLGGLRGNVCTPAIAHWKAHDQFAIHHNWTFFATSYGWDIISKNLLKSALFEGVWVTSGANFRGKGYRRPTTVGVSKQQWLPFRVVSKYLQCIVWFCHKARVWQMDEQTELWQLIQR